VRAAHPPALPSQRPVLYVGGIPTDFFFLPPFFFPAVFLVAAFFFFAIQPPLRNGTV